MQFFHGLSWIHNFPDSNSLSAKEMVTLESGRETEYNTALLLLESQNKIVWVESSSQKDVECTLAYKAENYNNDSNQDI